MRWDRSILGHRACFATFGVRDQVFEFVEVGSYGALGEDGLELVLCCRSYQLFILSVNLLSTSLGLSHVIAASIGFLSDPETNLGSIKGEERLTFANPSSLPTNAPCIALKLSGACAAIRGKQAAKLS